MSDSAPDNASAHRFELSITAASLEIWNDGLLKAATMDTLETVGILPCSLLSAE